MADCILGITTADLSGQRPSTIGEREAPTITLTDAQIKALPTTPIQILAAPVSGKARVLTRVVLIADTLSGAYTGIDPDAYLTVGRDGELAYVENDPTGSGTGVTDLLGTTAKRMAVVPSVAHSEEASGLGTLDAAVVDVSAFDGTAATISAGNGSGNFTGGNGANTLTIKPYFIEFELP